MTDPTKPAQRTPDTAVPRRPVLRRRLPAELELYLTTLEAEVEQLRLHARLDELDEVELTALGGRVVTDMLRAAHARREESDAAAAQAVQEARQQAERLHAEAAVEAARLRTEAIEQTDDLRERAERETAEQINHQLAEAQRIQDEALTFRDTTAVEARAEADALLEGARARAEEILEESLERRDILIAEVEAQRRWINALHEDIEVLRAAAVGAVTDVAKLADSITTRLAGPIERSRSIQRRIDSQQQRLTVSVTHDDLTIEEHRSSLAPAADTAR